MTTLTPSDTEGGNTKTPSVIPKKQRNVSKNWFFTWNNYPDTFDTILCQEFSNSKKYAFQEEIGQNGTKHIQGCVSFENARHFESLQKINKSIHWEKTKSIDDAIKYCTKKETRNGKQFTKGIPKPIQDPLEGKTLFPWQQKILEELKNDPDPRKINWYWEEKGNTGKTTFCKHLVITKKALYVQGKALDVKCAIAQLIEDGEPIEIVLWDIPRTCEGYVSYDAIESVKNGIFFSGKYESKQVIFNVPHIYIFANFEPETEKLSSDRWNIVKL